VCSDGFKLGSLETDEITTIGCFAVDEEDGGMKAIGDGRASAGG